MIKSTTKKCEGQIDIKYNDSDDNSKFIVHTEGSQISVVNLRTSS